MSKPIHFCQDQRKLQPKPPNSLGKMGINTSKGVMFPSICGKVFFAYLF